MLGKPSTLSQHPPQTLLLGFEPGAIGSPEERAHLPLTLVLHQRAGVPCPPVGAQEDGLNPP
jgi:hypothetical protein